MNAIDTTFATEAEDEDGSAENLGRIACREGKDESDNPFWQYGLYQDEQTCRAIEWQYGWQDEYDIRAAAKARATTHEAA